MSAKGKLVSIIVPAYNSARYIEAAVDSVRAQTFENWELLIINDGSTDETAKILDEFSDPRIHIFNQNNKGVSVARNIGLESARGNYVTFLDADDVLPENALEIRVRYLDENPDIDIVNGAVRLVREDGRSVRRYVPEITEGPLLDRLARLEEGVFIGTIYMLRRDCIRDHRFPAGVSHCEDLIFFLTLAHDECLRYGAVVDEVYEYRVRAGSAMSDLEGLEDGYFELLRRVAHMHQVDAASYRFLTRRVARILFRSWLRRGHLMRAAAARSSALQFARLL